MNAQQRLRSFERVRFAIEDRGDDGVAASLAISASRLLGAAGTGVSLTGAVREGCVPSTVFVSGVAEAAEMVQATVGEGPAYTVQRTGRPLAVPDLDGQRSWVLFGNAAEELGIHAVFAVPLVDGSGVLGAMSFYRRGAGDLSADEWDDATTLAELTVELLTGVGGLDQDLVLLASEPCASEISQATGMVGAQLRVDMPTALALLQSRAIGAGLSLRAIAQDVLTGHLHLDADR